jgi:TatA/E family protein of Tat protein translocase
MLSIPHIIVIFVVALIIFGPEKLPELARNLGKVMAEFRKYTGDVRSTLEGHLKEIEREGDARRIAPPAPAAVPAPIATPEAALPSPGTVTSKPPNAAALTPASGDLFPPTPAEPELNFSNPGNDPYDEVTRPGTGQHDRPSVPEPATARRDSDRETDGHIRPA